MVAVQQGVAQLVILIRELDGRLIEDDSFLHAVTLGKGTGGNITDDNLQRDDGNLLYQRLALIQLRNIVGGNALFFQICHQAVAHLIVDDPLTADGALFQSVERGGIILVLHNVERGIVRCKYLLGLSFVKLLQLLHKNCFLLILYLPQAEDLHTSLPVFPTRRVKKAAVQGAQSKKWKRAPKIFQTLASISEILHEQPIFVNSKGKNLFVFPTVFQKIVGMQEDR